MSITRSWENLVSISRKQLVLFWELKKISDGVLRKQLLLSKEHNKTIMHSLLANTANPISGCSSHLHSCVQECLVFPLSVLVCQRLEGFIEAPDCEKQHRNSMSNVRIGRLRRSVLWLPEVSHCLTPRGQREILLWEKHNYCKHLPSI